MMSIFPSANTKIPVGFFIMSLNPERVLVMEILILAVVMLVVTVASAVLSLFFHP